jgi:DNA replication protein DnaC
MRFIQSGQNIIISGPTGVGNSYLACALGNNICRNGFTAQFFRINTLIEKFSLERAKGTYLNFIKRLTSASVLILDDFGIKPLEPHSYQDLYDVIDDPVTCEAITDRVTANSLQIKMSGASYRQKKSTQVDKV